MTGETYTVHWRNPALRVGRTLTFATREEAEAYVEGRERKYGQFDGYERPLVEEKAQRIPRPFEHTGDSANIAFYRETGDEQGLWCEVLRSGLRFENGRARQKAIPDFYVIVRETRTGILGEFKYTPKSRPRDGRLSNRTVTRIVREWLATR